MQTAPKKVINAWAMFDWSNSVYNLVITSTFFPIYFLNSTSAAYGENSVRFFGRTFVNSALYDYALAAAYLLIAFLYPVLTSIADTRGHKKKFMQFFCYMGSFACCGLYFFNGSNVEYGVICFMMAAMGYVGSLVFYNSYLPEIAAPEDRDRISARGYSFGYIGSVILQLIGFALVLKMEDNKQQAILITFFLTGLWWMGFAQITFKYLPASVPSVKEHKKNIFKEGFIEIKKVYNQVSHMPVLKTYLRAFFFYSMAVQTVMLAAVTVASKLLKLNEVKLITTILIIQLVAVLGAWSLSRLSMKFGNFNALITAVFIWMGICVGAYYTAVIVESGQSGEYLFYGIAVAVGLVMGGIQSLSRSTYAKLMPETKDTSSFFSYYDFTEKIAIVLGLVTFGLMEELTGSMKNSILSLIVFFAIGLLILYSARAKQKKISVT